MCLDRILPPRRDRPVHFAIPERCWIFIPWRRDPPNPGARRRGPWRCQLPGSVRDQRHDRAAIRAAFPRWSPRFLVRARGGRRPGAEGVVAGRRCSYGDAADRQRDRANGGPSSCAALSPPLSSTVPVAHRRRRPRSTRPSPPALLPGRRRIRRPPASRDKDGDLVSPKFQRTHAVDRQR